MILANRTKEVKTSPTLALAAKAIELKSQGVDVVSLSVGEPDWGTFEECKVAGIAAINDGLTKYTPASGSKNLKNALVEHYNKRFDKNLTAKNVIVTPGAKYALQQAFWNLLNPGDKVAILVPYWASYTTMVKIAGGEPELISLNEDLSINIENLENSFKSGVKVLLINSPNNPSGSVLSTEDYQKISILLKKYEDVQIILDDIYSDLYWGADSKCPHFLDVAPELFERTLVVSGASKAFSMTGWRIGWAVGGEDIIGGLSRHQSQTTGCPNSIAQEATAVGVSSSQKSIAEAVEKLKMRAEKGFALLKKIDGVELQKPEGAFYFWVNVSSILKKIGLDDSEFCNQLLEEKAVVVVPGSEFGQAGYMRMSFAVSEELFAEGVKRLEAFIKEKLK
jgi:aspartate aminotransferase